MKGMLRNKDNELADQHIMQALQSTADESSAFGATCQWGFNMLKSSVESRGDSFDREGAVVLEEDENEVLRVPIASLPATIGSGPAADYTLIRTGISRLHAHLESVGSLVRIHDDGSTNGISLNGNKVEFEDLCDGDVLTLGSIELRVRKV